MSPYYALSGDASLDFVTSAVFGLLTEKNVDVYFVQLSTGTGRAEEISLAKQKRPVLQKITDRAVRLHPDVKPRVGDNIHVAYDSILQTVLKMLQERAAE